MDENNKFVNIARPRDIRITNLKTLKEIIKSIEVYYRVELIRKKKVEILNLLKQEIKELTILLSKLYEILPEHDLLEGKRKKVTDQQIHSMKTRSTKKNKKLAESYAPESEIEKLNKSLSAIEAKLKNI